MSSWNAQTYRQTSFRIALKFCWSSGNEFKAGVLFANLELFEAFVIFGRLCVLFWTSRKMSIDKSRTLITCDIPHDTRHAPQTMWHHYPAEAGTTFQSSYRQRRHLSIHQWKWYLKQRHNGSVGTTLISDTLRASKMNVSTTNHAAQIPFAPTRGRGTTPDMRIWNMPQCTRKERPVVWHKDPKEPRSNAK